MYALFDTLEQYQSKLNEVNAVYGYPDNTGTLNKYDTVPRQTTDGKYPMPVNSETEHLFNDCALIESVELLQSNIEGNF